MRPDEHKKKRSSAYKKKHNIAQTKGQGQPSDHKTRAQPSTEQHKHPEKPPVPSREQDDSDAEQEVNAFSKKAITSNWDRYKPISDDEEDFGADYEVLLSFGGDASSHIQLKHEQDWEAESNDFDVLAIDQKHLSTALASIPFCERYKLVELGVEPEMLQYISEIDDRELKQKANTAISIAPHTCDISFDFSSVSNEKETLPMKSTEREESFSELDSTQDSALEATDLDQSQLISKCHVKEPKDDDDRVIEELLSSKDHRYSDQNTALKLPGQSAQEVGDEGDDGEESDTKDVQGGEKGNGEVEDLEDWLDSIL